MRERMVYICDTCGRVHPTRAACAICESTHRKDCWIEDKIFTPGREDNTYPSAVRLGFGSFAGCEHKTLLYKRCDLED